MNKNKNNVMNVINVMKNFLMKNHWMFMIKLFIILLIKINIKIRIKTCYIYIILTKNIFIKCVVNKMLIMN